MESPSQDATERPEGEDEDQNAVPAQEKEDESNTNDDNNNNNNEENNAANDDKDAVTTQEREDESNTNDDTTDNNDEDSKDDNTDNINEEENNNNDEEKTDKEEDASDSEVIEQIDPFEILRMVCEKFIRRVDIWGVTKESWLEENVKALERFIQDTSIPTLVVYLDASTTLQVEYTVPTQAVEELVYFLREPGTAITPENFYEEVEYSTVQGDPTESLLQFINSLHSDENDISSDWETGIKDNYINGMHNYLAILTDNVSKKEGRTVLYIPMEGLNDSAEEGSKDTHLVQRMESVLIHWTDQIKELLNVQDFSGSDNSGPLQEIAYWESHSKKLRDMSKQLQKPGVKHIQQMLELANSLYVKRFLKLAKELQDSSVEAQSNLNFLSLLAGPCQELRNVQISELTPKLHHILYVIRIIWTNSTHYNTNERITGLFLKMSYEIIYLCIKSISLDRIFEGYVTSSKKSLKECIQCCLTWKNMYSRVSEVHHENSKKGWLLDQTNIFVPIDACIQRMKDLLEVCDTQQQFARWEDGNQRPLPCFSGYQGPERTLSLMKIEAKFQHGLQILRSVDQGILEVENTAWHVEFNRFRAFLKDLDVMLQNLITSVFKTVNSVEEGLRVMDIFKTVSARKSIKSKIDDMVDAIYGIFKRENSMIMKQIDKKMVLIPVYMPPLAGQAHRARAVKFHLESLMDVLKKIPIRAESHSCRQVLVSYEQSIRTLNDLVTQRFAEWYQSLELQYVKKLERPLLLHGKDKEIEVNFDNNLLNLFDEIKSWSRQNFEIPEFVSEIYQDREDLRCLRERALHLARDYNRIIGMLSPIERGLFSKKIHVLDVKIQPGFTKLFWMFKISSNTFLKDCLVHVSKVQVIVDGYKASNLTITNLCRQISETLLVRLDGKTLYRNWEFENDQSIHRQRQHELLRSALQRTVGIMTDIHNTFSKDGPEVQEHWVTYTEKVDHVLEEALRSNVKRSMQKLAHAINGDRKSSPTPLFRVLVSLRQADPKAELRVEFSPTLRELGQILDILPQLISTISKFKRLPELLSGEQSHENPIHVNIERDEEIKRIQAAVGAGMAATAGRLKEYLTTWDKYRDIWETNKDSYIQRYQKLNQPVASFDADIHRYTEIETSIQQEEMVTNFQFIVLDCSPLKTSLVHHCTQWQTKFMQLLVRIAGSSLKDMHASMNRNAKRLGEPNTTLAQLSESLGLLESFQGNLAKTEADVLLIHEQFAVLDKYGFPLDQTLQDLHGTLDTKWDWFQQVLIDNDVLLQGQKQNFKSDLLSSSEELTETIHTAVQEFNTTGPFDPTIGTKRALTMTAEHRNHLEALKEEENLILQGLNFFKIEQEPSKTIQALEKDMDFLQQVWEVTLEWDTDWDSWKGGQFTTLRTENMESKAQEIYKILHKLQRQLKDKNWDIVDVSKKRVDQFRRIIPLIADMRNPAMRDRHWKQICDEVQSSFDHTSDDFNLEKIISLGFDKYADKICEISGAASKELSIEQGLEEIIKTWDELTLDIVPYKDKGHFRLKGTEDILQALEDNQVTLSTMKASRFVKAFDKEVDTWERQLSQVMEIIEMVLTVQRQWIYLENIFQGKDIREQLPRECEEFEEVSSSWKTIMTRLHASNSALQGTHHPGLQETLSNMNAKLEEIQKALDMYLETKRQIFPRFYFLSNDDVLEILGQSQNPEAMQPHLKKCFDNIKSLRTEKVARRLDATAMFSSDGELVEFIKAVPLDKPVEIWLCDIEKAMRCTLKNSLHDCMVALKKMKSQRDKWSKDWPGQMLITASQIQWTTDVTQSLISCKETDDKGPLKTMMKKQVSLLRRYSDMIRSNLSKVLRLKIVALVTVEVHARDVIAKLAKAGCNDVNAFEWLSQLRLYWEKDLNNCIIRQTNTHFKYGYEYLGNSGRLVITPLTDRCYMTLTTALHLHRGGSPKGPAGTGKTETTKDLGKSLGMYVIVINCSEGLDYKSMGRMFSGLAQTGAWGCFDEFNRINIEVLSVVAQQILSILSALSALQTRFQFEEHNISLVASCGIFITMNPGYAGRSELPDNLKSMFRPISMVVPDSTLIAEIILFGEGFNDCKLLAKKVFTLYSLAMQQLSKQDHYDFGLRALTSLLRYAGKKRRVCPNVPGEEVLLMAMKDMNIAKLTSTDVPLFTGIIQDLFPDVETPVIDYGKLKEAIQLELCQKGLQVTPFTMTKVIQLFETKNSRHSSMLVGKTGCGKTVTWKTLKNALIAMHNKEMAGYELVQDYPLNPKSMSLGELYGENDLATNEWSDGVLSSVMRTACADDKPDEKWIVFDGPVDTLWIESMNSVMDDNKVLTLINGERISMPEQVSLLFEVENLAQASPATVSRCGMVYNDYIDLGWKPFVKSWLEKRQKAEVAHLKPLFDSFIEKTLNFKKKNCKELIPVTELNGIVSLCRLYDALTTKKVNMSDADSLGRIVELWFTFSLIWSICASVNEDGRKKMDNFLRELDGTFPIKDTVYEYYVDMKNKAWAPFENKLPKGWRFNPNSPFYKIMVPTVDTVRYNFLVTAMVNAQYPVLLTGPVGTGKTSVVHGVLHSLDSGKWSTLTINMSSQTTSNNIQAIVESRLEKRTKGVYVPVGGKDLLCYLDDLNMPAHDLFGSQPPLELMRLWIDYGFWFDRQKQTTTYVKKMSLLASMGPPGGGRTHISERLQSRFNLINMTFPNDSQIKRIFSTMINQKLQVFKEELKPVGELLTQATLELYYAVTARFLPTPAKTHYLFNLRDISKVFQGLLRSHPEFHDSKNNMVRLWIHECFRVFSDRLIDHSDMDAFVTLLGGKMGSIFDLVFHNICPDKQPPVFGDFLTESGVYEDLLDMANLKKFMLAHLEEYNLTPGVVPMNLVLFRDAIEHITRVVRVISQPRGNMLLVGVGGSGRQSLSRMAASISEYQVFEVEITKQYRKMEFREDIKKLYRLTGVDNKPTVFLFNDTQIVDESFLEDINNVLSSGEVPNLYKQDEFVEVCNALSDSARKENVVETPNSLFSFLIERVRSKLHIVLCMSPVGDPFRNRILQYPALVNCTTIDWFCEWPKDALLEVAERYLEGLDLGSSEGSQTKVASIFVTTHQSVVQGSHRMKVELKRHNYVTPTNYLELVTGYKKLLGEKRCELGEQVNKLQNGLFKISDTGEKVAAMTVQLEESNKQVADYQKECDEYLTVIVQQTREADSQQKTVSAKKEKIAAEESQCKALAETALRELDEALPALDEATKALESLNKKDMTEIKSYGRPPALVEKVMQAVMTLLNKEPTWAEAKRQLGEASFIKTLINFDKENISDRVLKRIGNYCRQPDFMPDTIGKVSLAAKSLCMWVRAMEVYGCVFRVVEPKRELLNAAEAQLSQKQGELAESENKLKEVGDKLARLNKSYAEKVATKEDLKRRSDEMEVKLDRADKLVKGLAGEGVRWEQTVKGLEENMGYLVGDCLLAASFLSYMGPFLSNYRVELLDIWMTEVQHQDIPCTPGFSFATFLSNPTAVRDWNIQGLPSDAFSTENGVIVTRGNRWPLMVDPQGQALKWIKKMELAKGLKVIDFQMPDYMLIMENAIQFGNPVLLQNVQEDLDPALNPVLNKSLTRIGGRLLLKLGDKELEYSPEFRFYITTKLSNPHYTPEISTKTTIVNFAVKEQGLEAQLLGIVVRKERPDLEEQKDNLVMSIASGKRSLQELEDEILRLLNEASGSLLDDVQLVNTLQTSKVTATEVSEQLESSEVTEIKIDTAREAYRACAQRASILFFILNDMGRIDPMYQFSLDAYINLFNLSIEKSKSSLKLEERIVNLNDYHTYAVYKYACRGLFEMHKLLFSFQMCAKILEVAGTLNMDEYSFFLRGGIVLDKRAQMENPCSNWLVDSSWDNITELDKLPNFHGIMASFEKYPRDWKLWFTSAQPEKSPLPGDWENSCNELQRMLIVRSLRPDRVLFCATTFIVNYLGPRFVEPPVLDMKAVVDESTCMSPLVFVLSPGVDPTGTLLQLAETTGMSKHFHALSLGQGQAPIAKKMIEEGVKKGHWVFLANCHLSLSWMPELDKLVEQLEVQKPHTDFRLWLSSSPHPDFPINILQAGIKMTTEPPKGVRANMKRLYHLVTDAQFTRCAKPVFYRKLLFSLCFFHSILLERKKFLQLGWNIIYGFNNSDFEVSENLLSLYLNEYEQIPWDALKYLIAEVNYGGHVTDDWDRRLLTTYINDYFCEAAVTEPYFKLSTLAAYYIPHDGPLSSYKDFINMLPTHEHPDLFGQHPNADIASQIAETRSLFDTLLSLQPQVTSASAVGAGPSREDKVLDLLADVRQTIPNLIDYESVSSHFLDPSPLDVVLLQEIQRYNALLSMIKSSLVELEKGIKGLVVMSSSLEETFNCMYDARVPPLWEKAYPSLKPLAAWTRDLCQRVLQFARWAEQGQPPNLFWLSGFTFPNGFLTAVLQSAARQHKISVDTLSWDFTVSSQEDGHIQNPPKDGVYVRGLYLEGAAWDKKGVCLVEAEPMQMVCPIPAINFKPVENRKKMAKNMYLCPCYYFPVRSGGAGRASFVIAVEVKSGSVNPDHWIKRGAALLMSLDS
ncbi:LOW QUALITY PROTEIN: dynein axonemal heavy chain 2 [Phyllopteryx taeniolatus]|uniref:LOW QUALITY PROTEIN: dynein axonemal heavy chain 2 n=1 Tax=Phyllopteryx taeniolatus TaxID=161469 RepID=UPI002AD2B865|nr:LOW QUALITY PROTEIN: dynein axonemal heavy chain 2 [Phyllopteryx taeniolatus]